MDAHGEFSVASKGQFLLIRCAGQWNYESAIHYAEVVLEHGRSMAPGPWCSLADLRDWSLGTPEATRPIVELSAALTRLGRHHAAGVVGENTLAQPVADQILSYVEQNETPNARYFETMEEAERWLHGLGYLR